MKLLLMMLALVVLAVAGLTTFAMLNLRAVIAAHQEQLVSRVERLLGRSITVGAVVPSWWPLGVRLHDVTIGEDPMFGSEPFLTAEGLVMAVRPWPLIAGRIEAAGVALDRPRVVFMRDGDGRWNVASLGAAVAERSDGDRAGAPKERRRSARIPMEWMIGIAVSDVHGGTLVVDDRRDGARRRVELHHVRLRAENVQLGATARLRLEAAVLRHDEPDLDVDLTMPNLGAADTEHAPFTARITLRDADLAVASRLLGWEAGAAGRTRHLAVDAEGPLATLQARVALDADDPTLRLGPVAVGGVGPLALAGRVMRSGERLTIEDGRATVGGLAVGVRGEGSLEPLRLALLLASEPDGEVALGDPEQPWMLQSLDGRVVLDRDGAALEPLRLVLDGAPFDVRGWVTRFDPPACDVRLEGRPFGGTVSAGLALEASGGARAHLEVSGLDLAAATARLAPAVAGRIEGRGSGALDVTGRIAGFAVAPGSLIGSGTLTVEEGRLRDVNVPDLVVAQIERIPFMPTLVSARTRSRYAELFASRDTVIESASVPFTVGKHRIATENASLVNPAYQITGAGRIAEGGDLRFDGTVLLGASVSRTLREDVRAAKYLQADDGRITLPFVARGPLGQVRVEPDAKRLKSRGLTALLGSSSKSRPRDDQPPAPDRREDEPIEDQVIERLERMLHP